MELRAAHHDSSRRFEAEAAAVSAAWSCETAAETQWIARRYAELRQAGLSPRDAMERVNAECVGSPWETWGPDAPRF